MTVVAENRVVKTYTYEQAEKKSVEYFNNSVLAASNFVRKYALRDGKNVYLESTPDDMHWRLAEEFARIDRLFGRSSDPGSYFDLMTNFEKIIPQGSPMMGIGSNLDVSLSNCFVVESPKDSIAGIFRTAEEIAQILKRRGGVGLDLSTLRPSGSRVNNAAIESSGIPCFSDFYSYISRMIGQKGRVGAMMLTLNIKHPDAHTNFVEMKKDLQKVTGANVSLLITDEFMEAVRDNRDFEHYWPIDSDDPKIIETKNARETFDRIIAAAYSTAEPGILMIDNIRRELPADCYAEYGFRTVSTNPCSELSLCPDDSCRLISMNLCGWVIDPYNGGAFNFSEFKKDVVEAVRMSDNLVELEIEKLTKLADISDGDVERKLWDRMINKARLGRRTGLGTHGLGDALAAMGLQYASDDAIKMCDKIYGTLANAAYGASVDLAIERGAFPIWDWNLEKDCAFIQRLDDSVKERLKEHGRRNIALLTNAPTGTVSLLSRAAGSVSPGTSSGIEPCFRLRHKRRVKITHSDTSYKVDFIDKSGDKWSEFNILHPAFEAWVQQSEHPVATSMRDLHLATIDTDEELRKRFDLPPEWDTSDMIDYTATIKQQAVIQSHIDHGIARTINMPATATKDDIRSVYMEGWISGLKGITVYVEGSRDGVLAATSTPIKPTILSRRPAPKRSKSLPCEIHRIKNGDEWTVLVGSMNGEPYEVFAGKSNDLLIPDDINAGTIIKIRKGTYIIEYEEDGMVLRERIRESFVGDDGKQIRLLVNMLLRHGVPVSSINHTIEKSTRDVTDFSRVVARTLKKHIQDGKTQHRCAKCGGIIIYKEGCESCDSCGQSKCL